MFKILKKNKLIKIVLLPRGAGIKYFEEHKK